MINGELEIDDPEEVVFRQVCPAAGFIDDGEPTWRAFHPTRNDDYKLSVARGSILTGYGAFLQREAFLERSGRNPPAGSWSIPIAEVRAEHARVVDDWKIDPQDGRLGHAYIDFRDKEHDSQAFAMILRGIADQVYPPKPSPVAASDDA